MGRLRRRMLGRRRQRRRPPIKAQPQAATLRPVRAEPLEWPSKRRPPRRLRLAPCFPFASRIALPRRSAPPLGKRADAWEAARASGLEFRPDGPAALGPRPRRLILPTLYERLRAAHAGCRSRRGPDGRSRKPDLGVRRQRNPLPPAGRQSQLARQRAASRLWRAARPAASRWPERRGPRSGPCWVPRLRDAERSQNWAQFRPGLPSSPRRRLVCR
jgi:hypothetical protein